MNATIEQALEEYLANPEAGMPDVLWREMACECPIEEIIARTEAGEDVDTAEVFTRHIARRRIVPMPSPLAEILNSNRETRSEVKDNASRNQ